MIRVIELLDRDRICPAIEPQNQIRGHTRAVHLVRTDPASEIDLVCQVTGLSGIKDRVIAKSSVEEVFVTASTPFESVVAYSPVELIVAAARADQVISRESADAIVHIGARKEIIAPGALDIEAPGQELHKTERAAIRKGERRDRRRGKHVIRIEIVDVQCIAAGSVMYQ